MPSHVVGWLQDAGGESAGPSMAPRSFTTEEPGETGPAVDARLEEGGIPTAAVDLAGAVSPRRVQARLEEWNLL